MWSEVTNLLASPLGSESEASTACANKEDDNSLISIANDSEIDSMDTQVENADTEDHVNNQCCQADTEDQVNNQPGKRRRLSRLRTKDSDWVSTRTELAPKVKTV